MDLRNLSDMRPPTADLYNNYRDSPDDGIHKASRSEYQANRSNIPIQKHVTTRHDSRSPQWQYSQAPSPWPNTLQTPVSLALHADSFMQD